MEQRDLPTPDGRILAAVDAGGTGPVVFWHPGSPHTGDLLEPVLAAAAEAGVRLLSAARPGYGRSTPLPGRDVAVGAADAALVADAFGVERFASVGYSGGGPHALACAALLPERTTAVATLAGIGPYTDDFDWFGGMAAPAALTAARGGRAARAAVPDEFEPASFVESDWAALDGSWGVLGSDAQRSGAQGDTGLIDDDVAFASDWGFAPAAVTVPVLIVQGDADRVVPPAHAAWLLDRLPDAELRIRPGDGHVAVLAALPDVLRWLAQRS